MDSDPAEAAILALLQARGAPKSISPEAAARALAGNPAPADWRRQLPPVKLAAQRLATAGRIEILHKGKPVAPAEARGVLRLRLPPET